MIGTTGLNYCLKCQEIDSCEYRYCHGWNTGISVLLRILSQNSDMRVCKVGEVWAEIGDCRTRTKNGYC